MAGAAKPKPTALTREIAAIIRERQGRLEKTNADLATGVGIGESLMGLILKGEKQIDIEQLDRMCIYLGLDLVDVIQRADESTSARRY